MCVGRCVDVEPTLSPSRWVLFKSTPWSSLGFSDEATLSPFKWEDCLDHNRHTITLPGQRTGTAETTGERCSSYRTVTTILSSRPSYLSVDPSRDASSSPSSLLRCVHSLGVCIAERMVEHVFTVANLRKAMIYRLLQIIFQMHSG